MTRTTVNRAERFSQVVSVRLTEYQSKRLQRTLKNFRIHGSSPSEQLRILLRKAHWSSVRYHAKHRELRRLQLRKENEAKALAVGGVCPAIAVAEGE